MKQLLVLLSVLFSSSLLAQATATATTSVTIVKPISITKTQDLDFGEISVNDTGGALSLSPQGSRRLSGGVNVPKETSREPRAASFLVQGEATSFNIALPETILLSDGQYFIKVDEFNHDSAGRLEDGSQVVNVGATLHVEGRQQPGYYTNSTDLSVTVNYN